MPAESSSFLAVALVFRLAISGRFRRPELTAVEDQPTHGLALLARVAIACLIAGAGLLSVADAGWAHAIAVGCLIGFVVVGFGASTAGEPNRWTQSRSETRSRTSGHHWCESAPALTG